jgi:hypothetical protein
LISARRKAVIDLEQIDLDLEQIDLEQIDLERAGMFHRAAKSA